MMRRYFPDPLVNLRDISWFIVGFSAEQQRNKNNSKVRLSHYGMYDIYSMHAGLYIRNQSLYYYYKQFIKVAR